MCLTEISPCFAVTQQTKRAFVRLRLRPSSPADWDVSSSDSSRRSSKSGCSSASEGVSLVGSEDHIRSWLKSRKAKQVQRQERMDGIRKDVLDGIHHDEARYKARDDDISLEEQIKRAHARLTAEALKPVCRFNVTSVL